MDTNTLPRPAPPVRAWPVVALAAPAFVAIWSGWVGLGGMTGFGKVHPLPGTPLAGWTLDTSITLPIGMEVYAAYALRVWLAGHLPARATRFAKWSAIGSLVLGAAGQVAYHLMAAAGVGQAPWQITTIVACLPVAVLGMGAALAHLIRDGATATAPAPAAAVSPPPGPNEQDARTAEDADDQADEDDGEDGRLVPAPRPAPRLTPRPAPGTATAPSSSAARRGGRPAGRTGTGARIAKVRDRYPHWTVKQVAEKAQVSERTVRRYLNTPGPTDPADQPGAAPDTAPGDAAGAAAAA